MHFDIKNYSPVPRRIQPPSRNATEPIYAARVGLGYRALAVLDGDVAVWFWMVPTLSTTNFCEHCEPSRLTSRLSGPA